EARYAIGFNCGTDVGLCCFPCYLLSYSDYLRTLHRMSYRISWLRCFFLLAWLLVSATVSPNLALAQASASPTGQEANSSQPEIEATSPLAAEAKVKLDEAAKQLADVQGQLNMRRNDDAALLELKTTSD